MTDGLQILKQMYITYNMTCLDCRSQIAKHLKQVTQKANHLNMSRVSCMLWLKEKRNENNLKLRAEKV